MNNKIFDTNVSLKPYCTIGIGGKAKYLYIAKSIKSLTNVYSYCLLHNIKCKVIGLGANLIFDDKGYNGAVIVNKTTKIFRRKNSIYVDSGTNINAILSYCYQKGLSGIENLAGIPASLGGAIVNNLGSNCCEIGNFVDFVICLDKYGKIKKLKQKQCKFEYRNSIFKQQNYVILRVKLNLINENKSNIKQNISFAINKKVSTQPLNQRSAGSVFKRCQIIPSLEIDKLGLKGTQVGGAMISPKHAGFIINTGNATSQDFKNLVNLINKSIYTAHNITLIPEVEFVDY